MQAWVRVAELLKAKGQDGGLVARSCNGLPFLLSVGLEVAFVPPQTDCPRNARVCSVQVAKEGSYLVAFDAVQDGETAHALAGCFCLAKKEDLPDMPEGAQGQEAGIDGFEVLDERFGAIGRVVEVLDNPGQRLICVTGEGGSFSIPFVDEFVKRIDQEASRVEVRIPAGLLDLATKPSQKRTEAGAGHED